MRALVGAVDAKPSDRNMELRGAAFRYRLDVCPGAISQQLIGTLLIENEDGWVLASPLLGSFPDPFADPAGYLVLEGGIATVELFADLLICVGESSREKLYGYGT